MPEPRSFEQTPSQTVGPFFGYALPYPGGPDVAAPWRPDAIRLHGTLFDGAGEGVPDAMIEVWQADAEGHVIEARGSLHREAGGIGRDIVTGFGRTATDRDGNYAFSTVKPGAAREGSAPYVLIVVFARGLLHHLFTRAYFDDEPRLNALDPLLARVDPTRRDTLIARSEPEGGYRFDIRIQGAGTHSEGETVFLDFGNEG